MDISEVLKAGDNTIQVKVTNTWVNRLIGDAQPDIKAGENIIEVRVTNTWVNRLIGDAQPDIKVKTTFTTMPFYKADSPLLPSGLMGTVRILIKK